MKSFRNFISEEVLPTAQVSDGALDIEKPAVRAAINAALAGVTSQPAVTPYVVFNRISKLLAQYHIILPKKFLEGDKGVEVFELRQFGLKMGMTDSGEFINQVPSTHYLFLQYGIISPFGITYAKPVVGGMFRVTARLVDKDELDRLLDMAEITMKEEAECRQNAAKAMAPKEEMHDITSDEKKKGNKEAVADSEKGLDEGRMPASVIKHKQKIASMTPEEKAKKFAGKSEEQLKSMARRHGYGKDSNEYSKHVKEEQIDELNQRKETRYKKIMKASKGSQGETRREKESSISSKLGGDVHKGEIRRALKKQKYGEKNIAQDKKDKERAEKLDHLRRFDIKSYWKMKDMKEETLDEKAPPGAKFERMVKHIKKGYSKDGLTSKEKSIAYATAWKAKKREESE